MWLWLTPVRTQGVSSSACPLLVQSSVGLAGSVEAAHTSGLGLSLGLCRGPEPPSTPGNSTSAPQAPAGHPMATRTTTNFCPLVLLLVHFLFLVWLQLLCFRILLLGLCLVMNSERTTEINGRGKTQFNY